MQDLSPQPHQQPTPAVALAALADELRHHRPNSPANYWTIRGRARTHGLDTDRIELLLPIPDAGTPRCEYAGQLRKIAGVSA
jgi:hypothetical protein